MTKMTKRDMFVALSNLANENRMFYVDADGAEVEVSADALLEFATHEIELLDKKADKAKTRASVKKAESDALLDAVREVMSDTDFESIPDITLRLNDEDITVGKVQYRLRKLVEGGEAEKQEISIPATETSKARKVQGYRLKSAEIDEPTNLESVED